MTGATAAGLCGFIDASPSPFHVCATVAARLTAAGFTELAETDSWPGSPGNYFTVRAGSLVAWKATDAANPFRIVGGHTDSRPFAPDAGITMTTAFAALAAGWAT